MPTTKHIVESLRYGRLPKEVIDLMASRPHRMQHYLWHQTRNSWNRYPKETKAALINLGWEPPRPHQDKDGNIILDNNAGEDFLFMHRQMIKTVNALLVKITGDELAAVEGWSRLPRPGDEIYPVPERYSHPDPFLNSVAAVTKTDAFYEKRLVFWERMYTDPGFLRSVTLGELGSRVEATIHDSMHMRWSSPPAPGIRPDTAAVPSPGPHHVLNIDPKWDVPEYDFLGDEYSAHVHPLFWKIHGWVDDRISDWMIANGVKIGFHTGMVEPDWTGTWQGVLPTPHSTRSARPEAGYEALLTLEASGRAEKASETAERHADESAAGQHENHGGHGGGHGGHGGHGDHEYMRNLESAVSAVLKSGVIHHMYSRPQGR